MKNSNVIQQARAFAKMAHEGQTRWGGEPYFEAHCEVVADYLAENIFDILTCYQIDFDLREVQAALAAAYLHDVLEDTDYNLDEFPDNIREACQVLCKSDDEDYCDYIKRVVNSREYISKVVKIADLRCNMSDLKEGQRKQKYKLAELIILDSLGR